MVVFQFEEAGDWNWACCYSNIKMCSNWYNIPAKFQKHCFIIGGDILNFVSHMCTSSKICVCNNFQNSIVLRGYSKKQTVKVLKEYVLSVTDY